MVAKVDGIERTPIGRRLYEAFESQANSTSRSQRLPKRLAGF
ncbi:hypothetical protein RMSM_05684 [Rhodopirellula maiorica SM1]|uniref:Uncharacterized protein n=1 Tax=Rhodopirellula maiorica SM1 TaxID=1265738 RepID=M5RDE5_9BACT|nr:hypothetical protein RMSM_05684 [Rhodopirellula maiorica SM1]